MNIEWTNLPSLPPLKEGSIQPGLAGPFAGLYANTLIVAGGANFPDTMPWHGGKKSYHSEIYTLRLPANGEPWRVGHDGTELPCRVAYGTSSTVPAGVVCMGGEKENGITDQVYIISIAGSQLLITPLPSLPVPHSNAASATVGSTVFIAGGVTPDGPSEGFWCLDTEAISTGWKRLADLPLPLINSAMTAVAGSKPALWIMGGRTRADNDDVSVIRPEVFSYSIADDNWKSEGVMTDGTDTVKLAAGTCASLDKKHIAVFGGNDGAVFNRVEKILSEMARENDTALLSAKRKQYIDLQESHPGFSRDVIIFDTETGKSYRAGEIPGPTQVTTIAVETPLGIIIPSGEIKPGVRTPEIRMVRIK